MIFDPEWYYSCACERTILLYILGSLGFSREMFNINLSNQNTARELASIRPPMRSLPHLRGEVASDSLGSRGGNQVAHIPSPCHASYHSFKIYNDKETTHVTCSLLFTCRKYLVLRVHWEEKRNLPHLLCLDNPCEIYTTAGLEPVALTKSCCSCLAYLYEGQVRAICT